MYIRLSLLNYFDHGFYGALHFCYICIYIYFRTYPLSFFLKNVVLILSEQERVSCCLSCVAPQESTLRMEQGFHCEPMIIFQTVWGSGGARKCMWGSWQVHAQSCGRAVAGCYASIPCSVSSMLARECSTALTCIGFKVSSATKTLEWDNVHLHAFVVLLLSAVFVSIVCCAQLLVFSFDCFSSPWQ